MSDKRCSRCGETKDPEEFAKRARAYDGLQDWCRECNKQQRLIYTAKFAHMTDDELNFANYGKQTKCYQCGKKFPSSTEFFSRSRSKSNGLQSRCRHCSKERK